MKKPTTLLTSVAALTVFTLGAWTMHEPTINPSFREFVRTGVITGWSVVADGTVSIRLEGQHKNRAFKLWFSTPANRTSTTRFEDLVLEAVMALSAKKDPAPVWVTSDTSNNESGGSLTDALPLRSLRQD